ncbi:oligoendopeptidase F [Actinomycetota bacterium]
MENIDKLKKRKDIDPGYKWNLGDMYSSLEKWETDYKDVKKRLPAFTSFSGRLEESPDILPEILDNYSSLMEKIEKLFIYAHMLKDQDNTNTDSQALLDRARSLMVEAESSSSYLVPEILKMDPVLLEDLIKSDNRLYDYRQFLKNISRQRKHVLSHEEEKILALSGEMAASSELIFGMIDNADIKFPAIKDEDGVSVELTKGRYSKFMESRDRRVRKDAFEALYTTYEKQKNTISSTLSSSVKKDLFFSKVRKYPSSIEASLFDDNAPISVYDNLINAVSVNLESMYKYMKLRKKALKVKELHMYDLYVPIVEDIDFKIPYEESIEMATESLKPLGKNYIDTLKEGLDGGWVDVYENEGKTSGAYSWGCYDTHPYILMNYENIINHTFILIHEMGHAMHTYYSNKNQPYMKAGYKIFVAEVASILNEILLTDHLLKTLEDEKKKLYILNHYLEQFRGTVYRQTMFAEFEKIIHNNSENQIPLTVESLSKIYHELNIKYYGPDILIDPLIDLEWARIPHFYSSFYVYKYAIGFSTAAALSENILNGNSDMVSKYIEFLSSGGSDYPIDLLKKAGVDVTSTEPVKNALKIFGRLVDNMEESLSL